MTSYDLYDEPDRPLTTADLIQSHWARQVGPDPVIDWCFLSRGQRQLYRTMLDLGLPVPALACRRGPKGKPSHRLP